MPKPLIQSTGRRKEAIARVRLRPGNGQITINARPIDAYFPTATHRMVVTEPLRLTQTAEVYDVDATLDGGGVTGQAGAMRLGIARALAELDAEMRPMLKRAGLLTRDAREGEQEVRPEEGPQGSAVLEALVPEGEVASQPRLRFGTDGVRARADALPTDEVRALGRATARVLGPRRWVIGRDTRESGPSIEAALAAGLVDEGAHVTLLGVLPTPAVAYASRRVGCAGGRHLRLAQPVRGQRHQAVRCGRAQAG